MKKKLLSCLLAGTMVLSLAACGDNTDATPDTTPNDVVAPSAPASVAVDAASLDFEDGNIGFVGYNSGILGGTSEADVSVVDYNGSKALKAVSTGKNICLAFQIDALLGDDVAKVAKVELTVGIDNPSGTFQAASGKLFGTYADGNFSTADWSVYLENGNPKRTAFSVADGMAFAEGSYFAVSLETDNANDNGLGRTNLYVDDVCFYDASGNLLAADSSAAFAAVEEGEDFSVLTLKDAVELEGFQVSAGGWAQAGIDLTDEQRALLVPGSVIEIEYKCGSPVWLVAIGENPLGGWLRGVNQETFVPDGFVSQDGTKVQYTYEQLVAYWGEDFGQYVGTLQCEGMEDWEVYSVKVGQNSGYTQVGSAVELEGFQVSAGGWAQAGIDLTDEQRALLVPGSVIEIEYKCDEPVWLVAIGENPLGGWLRGIDQETFVGGAANADGTKVQYTYEELAAFWGEDFGQYVGTLQCEGKSDWEVYSVKVGKPIYAMAKPVELEGFQVSAGGWAQAGIDLTDEQRALLVPGSVIEIEYKCDEPVWLVAIGENPLGGWLRGINQETFVGGAANADGSKVQYTYEELAAFLGEDFGQYVGTLQCEGKEDWEVYSVTIGMR